VSESADAPGTSPKPKGREARLDRAERVRREMARVYWQAKRGDVSATNAARFVFILAEIAKLLRDVEIEARLVALEHRYDS
jgi:hypothetical protein